MSGADGMGAGKTQAKAQNSAATEQVKQIAKVIRASGLTAP